MSFGITFNIKIFKDAQLQLYHPELLDDTSPFQA